MRSHPARALLTALLLLPAAAFAHTGAEHAGLMHGFAHPFGGIDHLLAMITVGILASRFERSQRVLLPLSFLSAMMLGGVLGARHLQLPFVEGFISLSLVAFGIAVLLARTPRFAFTASIVGVFALFHGHAHGAEMGAASPFGYSLGFLLATALLHAAGWYLGAFIQSRARGSDVPMRFAGSAVAIAGVALLGATF